MHKFACVESIHAKFIPTASRQAIAYRCAILFEYFYKKCQSIQLPPSISIGIYWFQWQRRHTFNVQPIGLCAACVLRCIRYGDGNYCAPSMETWVSRTNHTLLQRTSDDRPKKKPFVGRLLAMRPLQSLHESKAPNPSDQWFPRSAIKHKKKMTCNCWLNDNVKNAS